MGNENWMESLDELGEKSAYFIDWGECDGSSGIVCFERGEPVEMTLEEFKEWFPDGLIIRLAYGDTSL
jgi:Ni,Fe-hydrogenase I small subunit